MVKSKLKLRRGDTVSILRGKDRGKQGKILSVMPVEGRVIVEGLNLVHKHVRPRRGGEKGQRVQMPAPLIVAKVQLVCPNCKQRTRVAIRRQGDQRERVCKQCDVVIPHA